MVLIFRQNAWAWEITHLQTYCDSVTFTVKDEIRLQPLTNMREKLSK